MLRRWYITLSAMFTDLHVYMKVIVNGKALSGLSGPHGRQEWLKDYMCCDKILHFTLKVFAECRIGEGFSRAGPGDLLKACNDSALHLELVNMDKIDFVQKTQMVLDSG